MTNENVTTQKEQAAEVTGLPETKIQTVSFELDYLRRNGLLLDINISGVGLFTRSAQLAEFGIGANDEKNTRYTAGSKYLIPKRTVDELRSVESRMRQMHTKFCTDVAGFRPFRWLPYTGYKAYKRRWSDLQAEFDEIKERILDNLDGYRDLLAQEFAQGAKKTWAAVEGQGYGAIIFNHVGYYDKYAFVDAVVNLAISQFPSRSKIEDELHADYKVGVIFTDYDWQAAAESQKAQVETAIANKRAAYLQASMLQEEHDNQLRVNRLEQQKREIEIEAMMTAELEHAKGQLESMRHPFEEVFIALRQEIAQACEEILASITKNGFVRGKVAERASGLVEFYDLLAAHNDAELREKLADLKAKIGPIGDRGKDDEKRNTVAITETLRQITEMANLEAGRLAELSRAAFVEI
jgi:hypothetical protein